MSTIDLTLLGLILERPLSAYDLKKEIIYRNLDEWTKISVPSIFKKVNALEKQGYLKSKAIKNGNYAEKQLYRITNKGRQNFNKLMLAYAKQDIKLPIDLNTIVVNIEKVSKEERSIIFSSIEQQLDEKITKLSSVTPQRTHIPISGQAIIKQQLDLYKYLKNWVSNLKKLYAKKED